MAHCTVVGAGAWGVALALTLHRAGHAVTLVCEHERQRQEVDTQRKIIALPGIQLPQDWDVRLDIGRDPDMLLLVIPAQSVYEYAQSLPAMIAQGKLSPRTPIVIAAKGIDQQRGTLLTAVIENVCTNPVIILSGPNFALEVGQNLPAVTMLGCKDMSVAAQVARYFDHSAFTAYACDDPAGLQVAGSFKNVIAIATGIAGGAGWGLNAQAAILCAGLQEMAGYMEYFGGKAATLQTPAGIGDTVLTAMGNLSRNRQFGMAVGQGIQPKEWQQQAGTLVEGYYTTNALQKFTAPAERTIVHSLYEILYHEAAITRLLDILKP